jgi:signal transduction histidine kinase
MDPRFSFEGRTERLIALGRVVLASFSLLAIWFDPSEPANYAALTYSLLAGYVVYALGLASLVWTSSGSIFRLRLVTHVFDLGVFSVFIYLTEGPTSPFFLYFVFSILCGTLRWQWQGTLWTAVAALAAFLGMGFYAQHILQDPSFEFNRFIMRAVYLAVVAVLFGYLGVHESQRRIQLSQLAAWPHAPLLDLDEVLEQIMREARSILNTRRVLVAWEEPEEPWLWLVLFADGRLQRSRHPPESFAPLVAMPLEGKNFFSQDALDSATVAVDSDREELHHWQGESINADLRRRYDICSVLSPILLGENFKGRLFFLDSSRFTMDDLVLAEIVAAQFVASMDLFYFLQRLREVATVGERTRMSRDLHDGVLQSISTVGLRLRVASQLLDTDVASAKKELANLQDLILQEQRELRSFIERLKPTPLGAVDADFKLKQLLEELARSVERQWSLHVELTMHDLEREVPASLGREIYQLVREGIINAARHAHASVVQVILGADERNVHIAVCDDGRGFPFRGRYDDATLASSGLGPAMLRNRVASLGGRLQIQSSESGARLELTVPVPRAES